MLLTGAAVAAFAARAAVLALVGAAAALVGAKAATVLTAPATDGSASAPAETKVVPVGKFAALKPGGRVAVSQHLQYIMHLRNLCFCNDHHASLICFSDLKR